MSEQRTSLAARVLRCSPTTVRLQSAAQFSKARDRAHSVVRYGRGILSRWWRGFLREPAKAVTVPAVLLILVSVAAALVLRFARPEKILVVKSLDVPGASTVTGQGLATILEHQLRMIAQQASSANFASTTIYKEINFTGFEPPKTAVGLEVHGVSIDGLIELWLRLRQQQEVLEGSLQPWNDKTEIVIHDQSGHYWQTLSSNSSPEFDHACQQLAQQIFLSLRPDVLGWSYLRTGHPELALDAFYSYLQTVPTSYRALLYLGLAFDQMQRHQEALSFYDHALQLVSGRRPKAIIINAKAATFEETGRIRESLDLYRKAAKLDPGEPTYHLNIGRELAAKHQWNEAIDEYDRALSIDDQLPGAYFLKGEALREKGDPAGATANFSRSLQLRPAFWQASFSLASELLAGHDLAEAALVVRHALASNKDSAQLHELLAEILIEGGSFQEADAEAERSNYLDPNYSDALADIGYIRSQLGDYASSEVAYSRAVQLNPMKKDYIKGLALVLMHRHAFETYLEQKKNTTSGASQKIYGETLSLWENLPVTNNPSSVQYVTAFNLMVEHFVQAEQAELAPAVKN